MPLNDNRTYEQLRHHYEIERRLADRLRTASKAERKHLYPVLYDQLFRLVPDHPQLTIKENPHFARAAARMKLALVRPFLRKDSTLLELGAGDCAFSIEVAECVKQVIALDVSHTVTDGTILPRNMTLVISQDGSIPAFPQSIDIAYSNDLMEHLHPDDAFEQLQGIYSVLRPSGVYVFHTPNRLMGPSDISRHFDDFATGFHLHEYTVGELDCLLRGIGFARVCLYIGGRGRYVRFPLFLIRVLERFLERLPRSIRRPIARSLTTRALLGINIVAQKGGSSPECCRTGPR